MLLNNVMHLNRRTIYNQGLVIDMLLLSKTDDVNLSVAARSPWNMSSILIYETGA